MTRLRFPFKTAKQLTKQAGIRGNWCQQLNGRWKLSVEGGGLEWSPILSELSFFGDLGTCKRLQSLIEQVLKISLIAAPVQRGESADLETITSYQDLIGWLVRHMRSREQCEYPEPLICYAEELIQELCALEDKEDIAGFRHWSPFLGLGGSFAEMKSSGPCRAYSSMLMAMAGRLHNNLIVGEVEMVEAVWMALQTSQLRDQFQEKQIDDRAYLRSRKSFEQQFLIRVRIEDDDDDE